MVWYGLVKRFFEPDTLIKATSPLRKSSVIRTFPPIETMRAVLQRIHFLLLDLGVPKLPGHPPMSYMFKQGTRDRPYGPKSHLCTEHASGAIWGFPKIGVPPNHPNFSRMFPYKPSIWGYPHSWKPPFDGPSGHHSSQQFSSGNCVVHEIRVLLKNLPADTSNCPQRKFYQSPGANL